MRMLAPENTIRQSLDHFRICKARHIPRRNSQSTKDQRRKSRIVFAEALLFAPENGQRFILRPIPARNSRHRERVGEICEVIRQHFLQHQRVRHRYCKRRRIRSSRIRGDRIRRDGVAQTHRRNHRINQRQVPLAHQQIAFTRSHQRIRQRACLRRCFRRNLQRG